MRDARVWEHSQRDRNPNREAEQEGNAAHVASILRARGVALTGREDSDQLASLMSAVERFEAAVMARGGDLMVNDARSSEPENAAFRLPARDAGESAAAYAWRLKDAAELLERRAD